MTSHAIAVWVTTTPGSRRTADPSRRGAPAWRRCRAPAHRRRDGPAWTPRWPRGPAPWRATAAASSRRTRTTPSSSATMTSPGANDDSRADDRRLHVARGLLDGALGADGLGPHGEPHLGERRDVANARVDDQAAYAVGAQALREQVAEVAVVAGAGGSHDEEVAWPGLLDGHVDRPVVARSHLAGERVARDARRAVDRSEPVVEQAGTSLCLVHRGRARRCQARPRSPDRYAGCCGRRRAPVPPARSCGKPDLPNDGPSWVPFVSVQRKTGQRLKGERCRSRPRDPA